MITYPLLRACLRGESFCNKKLEFARIWETPYFFREPKGLYAVPTRITIEERPPKSSIESRGSANRRQAASRQQTDERELS